MDEARREIEDRAAGRIQATLESRAVREDCQSYYEDASDVLGSAMRGREARQRLRRERRSAMEESATALQASMRCSEGRKAVEQERMAVKQAETEERIGVIQGRRIHRVII